MYGKKAALSLIGYALESNSRRHHVAEVPLAVLSLPPLFRFEGGKWKVHQIISTPEPVTEWSDSMASKQRQGPSTFEKFSSNLFAGPEASAGDSVFVEIVLNGNKKVFGGLEAFR